MFGISAMFYGKFGVSHVKSELNIGTTVVDDAEEFAHGKVRFSKFIPELTLGMEKNIKGAMSVRLEVSYRIPGRTYGSVSSMSVIEDPDAPQRYKCQTKIKLESGGTVVRLLASRHLHF
jgi:hypothetical protein